MATAQKTVKQLAIEKGLLRLRGVKRASVKITDNVVSTPSSTSSTSLCQATSATALAVEREEEEEEGRLRYLIVIDFESTCWPDAASERFLHQKDQRPQEIIEFPAVLVDLR